MNQKTPGTYPQDAKSPNMQGFRGFMNGLGHVSGRFSWNFLRKPYASPATHQLKMFAPPGLGPASSTTAWLKGRGNGS